MSSNNRKIGLYSLEFENVDTSDKLEGEELQDYFRMLLQRIELEGFSTKKEVALTSRKFYYLSEYDDDNNVIKIKFESAKAGHRPELIDEETGGKRESPKRLGEGEAEITHLVAKYDSDSILIALEQRNVGVTISQITSYLNRFISQMGEEEGEGEEEEEEENIRYRVKSYIVPFEGFLEYLQNFSRINVCQVSFSKQHIGSEFLNFAELNETIRDTVELTLKSTRGNSIPRRIIRMLHESYNPQQVRRIRISGEDGNGSKIKLDTESLLLIKNIDVNLLEDTGIVDSNDIFQKLALILQND